MEIEREWINVSLFKYYDEDFENKTYLNCGLTTSTNRYHELEPLSFKFDLFCTHDNLRKVYNLPYEGCIDLKRSFDLIKKKLGNPLEQPIIIKKRYARDKDLIFTFQYNPTKNINICNLEIINNNNDFLVINFPLFPTFYSIYTLLNNFLENYFVNIHSMNKNYMDRKIEKHLFDINNSLKTQKITLENLSTPKVEDSNIIKEFNDLLGQEMNNIEIPELKEIEHPNENVNTTGLTEHVSPFFDKLITWDINTLETLFIEAFRSSDPIGELSEKFKTMYKDNTYEPLLNINEKDKKSIYHVTHFLKQVIESKHIIINESYVEKQTFLRNYYIPASCDVPNKINIELAYDLFSIFIFVELYRNLLKLKNKSFVLLKTEFYLSLGVTTFPFIFTYFFNTVTRGEVIRNVCDRFDTITKKLFKGYIDNITSSGLKMFKKSDFRRKCENLYDEYINGFSTTEQLHDNIYLNRSYILPYDNEFNLEQIINNIVPIEVICFPNHWDLINDDLLAEYNCNDETVKSFLLKQKPKRNKLVKNEFNLERFINSKMDTVNEEWKSPLNKLVLNFKDIDFNISDYSFPYEELPEVIIKALYCWTPKTDEKVVKNYKYYLDKIDKCILEKNNIIDLGKAENKEESIDDWSSFDY